jgi:hypothetical protein
MNGALKDQLEARDRQIAQMRAALEALQQATGGTTYPDDHPIWEARRLAENALGSLIAGGLKVDKHDKANYAPPSLVQQVTTAIYSELIDTGFKRAWSGVIDYAKLGEAVAQVAAAHYETQIAELVERLQLTEKWRWDEGNTGPFEPSGVLAKYIFKPDTRITGNLKAEEITG